MQLAPDQLQRQLKVNEPDKARVSDTTFIPTRQGGLYLINGVRVIDLVIQEAYRAASTHGDASWPAYPAFIYPIAPSM